MHPVVALVVGLVVAWAVKPHDEADELKWWRLAAGAAGALYPYLDFVLRLLGPGAYLQLGDGLTWALPLVPFHAILVSVGLSVLAWRKWSFTEVYVPVVAAMGSTVLLALMTDDGIAPLALLWSGRLGFGLLYPFDALILGLSLLTLAMGTIFFPFQRYVARIGLVCIGLYILSNIGFAWQARDVGYDYAAVHKLKVVDVHALPQPLSPLNWRVMVEDSRGFVHDTLINLKRKQVMTLPKEGATRAARIDALYRPKDRAVWRVYDRFGGPGKEAPQERRRAERAWQAWQATTFGWYGRYGVFDTVIYEPVKGLHAACVQFVDLRYLAARDEAHGLYAICPRGKQGGARVFRATGNETYVELVPLLSVGNVR